MAAPDRTQGGFLEPGTNAIAVTPSDSTELAFLPRELYIGGTGHLAVEMKSGAQVTFSAVPAGKILRIRVNKVLSTGTTATLILAIE